MQTKWYGDNRDVVKWATVILLCGEQGFKTVVYAPFLNDSPFSHELLFDGLSHGFPDGVWAHFRDLNHLKTLCGRAGLEIDIVAGYFKSADRASYINSICAAVQKRSEPQAVFLDPDTGLAPRRSKPTERHVTVAEIQHVWRYLKTSDWLVLYQHSFRKKGWQSFQRRRFAGACEGATVRVCQCRELAPDVVFLCARKKA